jgi:KUP system potassium uptake protein
LTRQAIQLGYIPRMHIQHTSSAEQGQIYIGAVNWALMVGVILLVLGFESGALACLWRGGTGTMLITSILVSAVMLLLWKWPPVLAVPILVGFLLVDGLFLPPTCQKSFRVVPSRFWRGSLFVLMTTWKRGKELLVDRLDEGGLPLPIFISSIAVQPPHRVQGTAVLHGSAGRRASRVVAQPVA